MKNLKNTVNKKIDIKEILKNNKIKFSTKKEAILEILIEASHPHTAEEVRNYLENRGLKLDESTLYRNLAIFVKKDIIKKLELKKNKKFFEYNKNHHHHIVCNKCLLIEEIDFCEVKKIEKGIKSQKFAIITDHELDFYGICKKCI